MDEKEYLDSGDFEESSESDPPSIQEVEEQEMIMDEMEYLDAEGFEEFPETDLPSVQDGTAV